MVRQARVRALADQQDLRTRRPQGPVQRRHRPRRRRAVGTRARGRVHPPPLWWRGSPWTKRTRRYASCCASTIRSASPRWRGSSATDGPGSPPPSTAPAAARTGQPCSTCRLPHPRAGPMNSSKPSCAVSAATPPAGPSRADFQAAGATGLLVAIYAGYVSRWWAQRLGLSTAGLRARRREGRRTSPSRRRSSSEG